MRETLETTIERMYRSKPWIYWGVVAVTSIFIALLVFGGIGASISSSNVNWNPAGVAVEDLIGTWHRGPQVLELRPGGSYRLSHPPQEGDWQIDDWNLTFSKYPGLWRVISVDGEYHLLRDYRGIDGPRIHYERVHE